MANLIENFPEILTACRFYLELKLDGSQDPVDGYFMECQGFKTTQEIIEVCEVTPQKWGQNNQLGNLVRTKIPGNVKANNITLKRGLTISQTLWNWFNQVQQGNWEKQRHSGSLTIYDQAQTIRALFSFRGAWPTSYSIADVSASSSDIEIESVELACEGFIREQ